MANESLTASEAKTLKDIETGLEEMKKGGVTKTEMHNFIEERKEIDAAYKTQLEQQNKEILRLRSEADEEKLKSDELKALADQFQSKLNAMRSNNFAMLKNPDGSYNGMLKDPMTAKAFGLMIMAAANAGTKHITKHHAAIKALQENAFGVPKWYDEKDLEIKAMTEVVMTGGAALITAEMIPILIQLFEQYGKFEGNALAVPLATGQSVQPKTDTLLSLYAPGQGGTIPALDPKVDLVSHVLTTLCALTAYSLELDVDSAIPLGELIAQILVRSYGYGIDKIGFLGDGTSTYFGMTGIAGALRKVNSTISKIRGVVVGASGTGADYTKFALTDFTKLQGVMPDFADDQDLKWYMHRYYYYTVPIALAFAAGGVRAQEVILGAGERQKIFFGYPVEFAQVMPRTVAINQLCCLFANLKLGAQIGRKGVLEIQQSIDRYFEMGLVGVRARRRISINCFGVGHSTDEVNTIAGPICGLYTYSS